MWPLEFHALVKREQYRDYLAVNAEDRLARALRSTEPRPDPALRLLPHRLARWLAPRLGRILLRLGQGFVRIGKALEIYGSPAHP
jgi:hypothetical protein